jgi:hypothetical protein
MTRRKKLWKCKIIDDRKDEAVAMKFTGDRKEEVVTA